MNTSEIEKVVLSYAPKEEGNQKRVLRSMNYSLKAGGKRLRPEMMFLSYSMFGGKDKNEIAPFMAALEMIHTYSLIHDDLPAMDDDDYRRGIPTNHKIFDEATAILAGDGLLNMSFEIATKAVADEKDPQKMARKARAAYYLASRSGVYGMIGGQMADIESENKETLSEDEILFIHENKTAALIKAGLCIGAIIAGASESDVDKMEQLGHLVGVAFQIQDDILDVIGNEKELGKPIGSDIQNGKVTFVTIHGVDEATRIQKEMSDKAVAILESIDGDSDELTKLIKGLVNRKN